MDSTSIGTETPQHRTLHPSFLEKVPEKNMPESLRKWKKEKAPSFTDFQNLFENSLIAGENPNKRKALFERINDSIQFSEFISVLKTDSVYQLADHMRNFYFQNILPEYKEKQLKIDDLQKKYMSLQMEIDKNKKFFPDANSTLRVTYGVIKGSSPRDGINYKYQTYLDGVMEKYIPKDYEFDVPQKFIDLYNAQDYGIYKDKTGKIPVNFTATNHTTGGNSGSPAIDAYGNLIGLNFDRQWEGTMSDINYDAKLCRNIMVNTKYILFIIDKYADSKHLIQEMKIVK